MWSGDIVPEPFSDLTESRAAPHPMKVSYGPVSIPTKADGITMARATPDTGYRATGVIVGGCAALLSAKAHAAGLQSVRPNDPAPRAAASVQVPADDAVAGTTGCSRFRGSARVHGGDPVIDGLVATARVACPGDGPESQGEGIIGVLRESRATRLQIRSDPPAGLQHLFNPKRTSRHE
ncbi:META domain-containing protein [Rhodovulum sp. YNF3179]|uniref:META domain-containing protein n=1 Tax=Rhodovulum sp. YNF3179 TaxID=3425127 RepID=UPI003D33ED06